VVLTARSVPDQGGVVMMAAKLWGEGGVTTEHNKRLVHRALQEIYARGHLELANELVHPDFVDHEPAHSEQPTGPESVKQTVRRLQGKAFGVRLVR
jgi:hypothetical protein